MSATSVLARARVQGIGVLLVVFASGVLAGAAFTRWRDSAREGEPGATGSTPAVVVPTQDVIVAMKMARTGVPLVYETLGLTQTQREQIRAIMDANRPRTDSLLRTTWPSLRTLLDTVQRQVERVLTPEQRSRLQAMRGGVSFTPQPNGRSRP
jgi:type IV pilus biogenesis protein CpaD/CtpE